jgi:hypothetical protein
MINLTKIFTGVKNQAYSGSLGKNSMFLLKKSEVADKNLGILETANWLTSCYREEIKEINNLINKNGYKCYIAICRDNSQKELYYALCIG